MFIYEKIFERLDELKMSQVELSRRTGIATSTISDWRKKRINPQADKLVTICKALDLSLVELLCDEKECVAPKIENDYSMENKIIIEKIINSSSEIKKSVICYFDELTREKVSERELDESKNISIVQDVDGNKIVFINDIIFKSRRAINWDEIEIILKKYIGNCYEITETAEKVYIGTDFPDEYTHSKYTKALRGANEKAKANAITVIEDLIAIADNRNKMPDYDGRHKNKAKNGWYRYDIRFGIPVYSKLGEIDRYNVFRARVIVRCNDKNELFLYDIVQIKKETSTPLE